MTDHSNIALDGRPVLIVDDDPAVRSSLQFRLEIEGYSVRTYARGADLLDDPAISSAGCLVIDYRLPDMNGLDLLLDLRRRAIKLPAILITTHPSASVRARAAAAGAALIEKPLLSEALIDGIRSAIRQHN